MSTPQLRNSTTPQLPDKSQLPTSKTAKNPNSQLRQLPIEIWRLRLGRSLGVVELRSCGVDHDHLAGASGFPGPKCFKITSGSESLRFSMLTPSRAASDETNSSSSVIWPKRIIAGVDTGRVPNRP